MAVMRDLAMIFFGMILVNNYVLVQFLGICPFLGVSKKLDSAVGMSCRRHLRHGAWPPVVTWPIYTYLLEPNGMAYLQTIVFILIIAVLVQLVEIILKKFMPAAVQGAGCVSAAHHHQLRGAGRDNFRAGRGLQLCREHGVRCGRRAWASWWPWCCSPGVRKRLEDAQPPKCFEGLPITLVAASVTSLSFMGFGGVIENIFAGH